MLLVHPTQKKHLQRLKEHHGGDSVIDIYIYIYQDSSRLAMFLLCQWDQGRASWKATCYSSRPENLEAMSWEPFSSGVDAKSKRPFFGGDS